MQYFLNETQVVPDFITEKLRTWFMQAYIRTAVWITSIAVKNKRMLKHKLTLIIFHF